MRTKKKHYWVQEQHHHIVILPKHTIVHPCLDITDLKDVSGIPKCV